MLHYCKGQGRRLMELAAAPSRDLTPESLRGSRRGDLTLGIALDACTASVGFHRFEPVDECDRSHSGQFHLPDKEFRYLRTVRFLLLPTEDVGGTSISVVLFASPRRPDYLITAFVSCVWRLVSEDSRTLQESSRHRNGDCRHHSCPNEPAEFLGSLLD